MIGEYYVVTQSNGDQYLYVIPTVYNKISKDNPYTPKNGSIVQMYAQFESPGTTTLTSPFYESWSCNMKYFTDLTNRDKSDTVEPIYYQGTKLLQSQRGTFSSSNNSQQVSRSAWKNDLELSLIRKSNENAVGDKYMIYQCGMYRKFFDEASTQNLKIGLEFNWIYGYRLYKSLGDYSVEIQDGGTGKMKLIDSTISAASGSTAITVAGALATLATTLALF